MLPKVDPHQRQMVVGWPSTKTGRQWHIDAPSLLSWVDQAYFLLLPCLDTLLHIYWNQIPGNFVQGLLWEEPKLRYMIVLDGIQAMQG